MSHHVVGYLNAYRKPDCKLGRITNTEDFKHLARKLTHGIMAKELKHCRNIEDLEVNENVKHKAKEYIRKYMGRYGKLYKKDPAETDIWWSIHWHTVLTMCEEKEKFPSHTS